MDICGEITFSVMSQVMCFYSLNPSLRCKNTLKVLYIERKCYFQCCLLGVYLISHVFCIAQERSIFNSLIKLSM
jgi:hypothetical protein